MTFPIALESIITRYQESFSKHGPFVIGIGREDLWKITLAKTKELNSEVSHD